MNPSAGKLAKKFGVTGVIAEALVAAGYSSVNRVRAASKADLQRVKGIGPSLAGKIYNRYR